MRGRGHVRRVEGLVGGVDDLIASMAAQLGCVSHCGEALC